jgi:uncharacterized protein (TIGR03435 family)
MLRIFACAAIALIPASAQQTTPSTFDVASVKVNQTVEGHTSAHSYRGGLEMTNVTLKFCLTRAYHIADPQVIGPGWLDTERYDIVAKAPADAAESQIPDMLQSLLASRFKVVAHREQRELNVFALVVAKDAPKIQKVESNGSGGSMATETGHAKATTVTMARLAEFLASSRAGLGIPVVDQTGLDGTYTFNLDWTPERPSGEKPRSDARADAPPPLLDALQEQLGLKLVKRKLPIEVLVVDHAEKVPTEN